MIQIVFREDLIEVILKEKDKEEEGVLHSQTKINLFFFKHSDISTLGNNWGKNKIEHGLGYFGEFYHRGALSSKYMEQVRLFPI